MQCIVNYPSFIGDLGGKKQGAKLRGEKKRKAAAAVVLLLLLLLLLCCWRGNQATEVCEINAVYRIIRTTLSLSLLEEVAKLNETLLRSLSYSSVGTVVIGPKVFNVVSLRSKTERAEFFDPNSFSRITAMHTKNPGIETGLQLCLMKEFIIHLLHMCAVHSSIKGQWIIILLDII